MTIRPACSIGDFAPPLTLPDEDGNEFALKALKGRPILVTFLSHAA